VVLWEPTDRQKVMMKCMADERFFGGAKGGGKTEGGLGDWLLQMALCRRVGELAKGVFFRRSYNELDEVIQRTQLLFPRIGGVWKEAKRKWEFPGHGVLLMRFIEKDSDAMKYQGHEYNWINFDELGNYPTPFAYNQMLSCLRNPSQAPKRMLASGNPGGPGQAWVKRRWISGKKPDVIYVYKNTIKINTVITEVETSRCFIPSKVSDNKYLMDNDPKYVGRLASLPEHLRRAFLEGDWDVSVGQVFGELSDEHKCRPFQIPRDWDRFATLDWGYMKPYSLGIWAMAPNGRLFRVGEDYGCVPGMEDEGVRMDATTAGKRFLRITNAMGIDKVLADPACWTRHGHGATIGELLSGTGLRVLPADRDRVAALQTFHSMLQTKLEDGGPAFKAFDTCENWWRTVPNLTSSRTNIEDVDTTGEDHTYDDTRFAIMSPDVIRRLPKMEYTRGNYMRERDYAR
jgi:hypothetical protein